MAISLKKNGITAVAQRAGVSLMTVTRTFSGCAPVAKKTREKVLSAARELRYRPDPFAQAMRGSGTRSIGLLWGLGGPHSPMDTVHRLTWQLHNQGYAVYINDAMGDPEAISNALTDYAARRVDGVVLCVYNAGLLDRPEIRSQLSKLKVIVCTPEDRDIDCDKLILDTYQAVEDITDHFALSGRKRVVAIADRITLWPRLNVIRRRLEYHGLDAENFFIPRDARKDLPLGVDFVNGLKQAYPTGRYPFDAVWCTCDEGAAGVIQSLIESGYRVPEDIAVVGFNDSEISAYFEPPIASVNRMTAKAIDIIINMLLARIKKPDLPFQKDMINMKFIKRRSAG